MFFLLSACRIQHMFTQAYQIPRVLKLTRSALLLLRRALSSALCNLQMLQPVLLEVIESLKARV